MTRRMLNGLLPAVGLALWAGAACAEMRLNFQPQATLLGHAIYNLHTVILLICVVIFVGVFGAMLYSIVYHRKSLGHKAAHFHENTTVKLLWTVIPFLILVGMAYPATKTLLAERDTSAADLTIKATGYQWKWQYDYLQDGVSFFSVLATPQAQIHNTEPKGEHYLLEVDNPMVVPVGKKVRILTTAGDVLHSWYVPALAVKQDAIPGFVRDTWFKVETPGIYRGQCAELCGKEHGFMPIVVRAVTDDEYQQWLREQKAKAGSSTQADASEATGGNTQVSVAEPAAAGAAQSGTADGKGVYDQTCQMCHATGLAGAPKFGDKAVWGPRIAQGEATLWNHAISGIRMMPPKGGNVALSDAQVKAAVDYMVSKAK
jgi:cytochrome c oxidase subunit II